MALYAFELGRMKDLCREEVLSLLGREKLVEFNLDTAIFELEELQAESLQDRLGGTIKIVKVSDQLEKNCSIKEIKAIIKRIVEEEFSEAGGKIPFSISYLSYKRVNRGQIRELLSFAKQEIKNLGLNCRFVNKNFQNTRPSTIYKAKVIEKGVDINIIDGKNKIFIGEAISIQNIDKYSKRDYEKPKRDAKVGMTPPKLAQIMINLAGKDTQNVYDPFCGTGTYLIEALLMGKNAIGSDFEERMVEYSEENVSWAESQWQTKGTSRVFHRDARFITKELLPEKVDAIVTEGYLGTPVNKLPSPHEREVTFRELGNLHLNWLTAAAKVTPKHCKIVTCIAAFQNGHKIESLPKLEQLVQTAGYKIEKRFLYSRPDQIVVREILVLSKLR